MATKFEAIELAHKVSAPFSVLAREIEQKHRVKLVNQWIKTELVPRMEKWRDAEPSLYRVNRNTMGAQSIHIDDQYYPLPTTMDWPRYLPTDLVTMEEISSKYATDEVKEQMAQAKKLKDKCQDLYNRLVLFLEGFTSLEQAIFSLPELKAFAPVKCASQKRPRFFRVPTNELRQLMMEAARLKEALAARKE